MHPRRVRKWFTAVGVAACLSFATPAKAAVIQLGFLLDSSGSITAGGWDTIRNGLADAINTLIPIGGADTYEISVVSFASGTSVIVDAMLIDSAAARAAASAAVAAAPFLNANTNYNAAFTALQGVLTASANFNAAGRSYVNFATDGVPNEGGGEAGAVTARNALIAAGVDNISIEAIGSGVNAGFLTGSICFPGPCDTIVPFDFPNQGFYIGVADAAGYAAAISRKIQVVTGVPEPTSMMLLGAGLALAGRRLRRRA